MIIIGGNLLKNVLLILIIISHSYSLLCILSMLMIPYQGGTDRVVIGSIWIFRCMWKWTGSRRMGHRSRIMHVGSRGL